MIVTRAKAEEARCILDIYTELDDEEFDVELVNMSYRLAAKDAHPDAGGSAEAFARIDWAKCALLAWLNKQRPEQPTHEKEDCTVCSGKGWLVSRKGFSGGVRRQCQRCHGSGDANWEVDRNDNFG